MSSSAYRRQDAPLEATWNKERLFADWQAWETSFAVAKQTLERIQQERPKALDHPQALGDWLGNIFDLSQSMLDLRVYVHLETNVDADNMQAKGFFGQISSLLGELGSMFGSFEAEVLPMEDTLTTWLEDNTQLAIYQHLFQDIFRNKKHLRSPEIEEILNLLGDPLSQVSRTASELMNTDLKFKEAINSKGERFPTLQSTITPTGIQDADRERRRTAWQHYSDGYISMINTFASNYIAYAKAEVMVAKARGFNSILERRLAPSNLPVDVFHTLMDACKDHAGIWHKYWEVKRKALGVEQVHPYDIWAPVVDVPPTIQYLEGAEWIIESVKPLGSEYTEILSKGILHDRWVDWAPNAGKRQGAFAAPGPVVFTSYNDTMVELSILAHELGHAMHAYCRQRGQPYVYAYHLSEGSALGETPSNLGQALLRHYLRMEKSEDDTFQLALIDEAMFNFHRYFFQMPNLAQFELEFFDRIWHGKPVNAEILNDIMSEIYTRGYGDTMTDDPERTATTWAQFPHMYMPFYTFQYAVGISAAHSIADRIVGGVDGASDDFINMISAGSSLYPMDLFSLAGIDMTTSEPIEKAFGVLSNLVDQMDELVS